MTIKNFRHGRLYIESGDTVPLVKVVTFSGATFTFTETRNREVIRDRGTIVEVTPGNDEPVEWSFSAQYEDKTSFRTVRDGVWDGQAETIVGLVGAALNANVATVYDFEQNSLLIAAGDPIAPGTKLAVAAVPAVAGEFSEELGSQNVEVVITVSRVDGFNIFMPVADVDIDVVYDAVGEPTLSVVTAGACPGSIQFFRLRLDIYDPCDPPDPLDLLVGTVVEQVIIDNAYLLEDTFSENEDADEVAFSGAALIDKVLFVTVP